MLSVIHKPSLRSEFKAFLKFFQKYLKKRFYTHFLRFEVVKDVVVDLLYKKRGKYARPFLHAGMMSMLFVGITVGPIILKEVSAEETITDALPSGVLTSATEYGQSMTTTQGKEVLEYRGGEVIEHEVKEGETVA